MLPPDQANALVLQLTEGCRSECTFCDAYRQMMYRLRTIAQFRQHVREAIAYHGESLSSYHSIFLGEASALSAPMTSLRGVLRILAKEFPALESAGALSVGGFLDADTGARRRLSDWKELRQSGLRNVYIGMETGDDALLRWMRKPASSDSVRRCVGLLKEAELNVGLIVLLGAGGRQFYDVHVRETSALLNELPLDRGDHIFFSLLEIGPNAPYALHTMAAGIECLTDAQMGEQETAIRSALRFSGARRRPALARYDLETFVY